MKFLKYEYRTIVTNYHNDKIINIDSWINEYNKFDLKRRVIKLGYMYMNQVVHDALYDALDCELCFMYDNNFGDIVLPEAQVRLKGGQPIYKIQTQLVIHIDDHHIQYRGHVISIDDATCRIIVVDGFNGFYVNSYDFSGDVKKLLIDQIYCEIDRLSAK